MTTTATLTEQWPKQWAERGFLPMVDVLAPDEATRCRAQFDALEREVGPDTAEIRILDRHLDVEFVWRLATHPRVLDAVEAVLGPDVLLLASNFFCKYPAEERGERFVAWHQDVTYWGLEPARAITAWIAIDDADVENGCMSVIPGSHRLGILEHGKSDRDGQPPQHQPGGAGRARRRGAGGLDAAPRGADVAPRRDAAPREPSQPLEPPPLRARGAIHHARRPPGVPELAPRLLPPDPRARHRSPPPLPPGRGALARLTGMTADRPSDRVAR